MYVSELREVGHCPESHPSPLSRINAEVENNFLSVSLMSIEITADAGRALSEEYGQGSHPVLRAIHYSTLNKHCSPTQLRHPLTQAFASSPQKTLCCFY